MLPPFRNEPFTNFNDPANKAAFEAALKVVESRFGEYSRAALRRQGALLPLAMMISGATDQQSYLHRTL